MPEPARSDIGAEVEDNSTPLGAESASVDMPHLVELAATSEPEYVDYLGVRLPKGSGEEEQVPQRNEHYIEDEFSQELQRDLATAFALHQPVYIEGGTSLGKSTAVRKMAAELGWSVHYVNMVGSSDNLDLMGQYGPNPERRSAEDPEYMFANGPVTAAIEEAIKGHKVLLMVDEFNAATPNILIRLHEIIDAYETSGMVTITEDASKRLKVIRENLSVVAIGNPPSRSGSQYAERHPLDPAQFRRWVYLKLPDELPEESVENSVQAVFGLKKGTEIASPHPDKYLHSSERSLTREELGAIPGMADMAEQILIFHTLAKGQADTKEIGRDQPQPISYDDREELNRVAEFICNFYNGDLNETVHRALIYYYANKLADPAERQAMIDRIHTIKVEDIGDSRRRGVGASGAELPTNPEILRDPEYIAQRLQERQDSSRPGGPAKDAHILTALAGNDSITAWTIRLKLKDKAGTAKAYGRSLAGSTNIDVLDEVELFIRSGKFAAGFNGVVGHDVVNQFDGEVNFVNEVKSRIDDFDEQDINAIVTSLAGLSQTPELTGLMVFFKQAGKKPSAVALGMRFIEYPNTTDVKLDLLGAEMISFGYNQSERDIAIAWAISGDDSSAARAIRDEFINTHKNEALAISLAGIDTEWAWDQRMVLAGSVSEAAHAKSMSGCFSPIAWQVREDRYGDRPDYYAMSIGNNWVLQALISAENTPTTSAPTLLPLTGALMPSGGSTPSGSSIPTGSSPIGTPIAGSAFAPAGSPISPPPPTSPPSPTIPPPITITPEDLRSPIIDDIDTDMDRWQIEQKNRKEALEKREAQRQRNIAKAKAIVKERRERREREADL